jgi:hypothetical protein
MNSPLLYHSGSGGTGSTSLGALTDVDVSTGAGVDGYALTWDNASGKFVLTAHVSAADPHTGYLLATGTRAGATDQKQSFGRGIATADTTALVGGSSSSEFSLTSTPLTAANGTFITVNAASTSNGAACTGSVIGIKGHGVITANYADVVAGVEAVAQNDSSDITIVNKSLYGLRAYCTLTAGNVAHAMGVKINSPILSGGATVDHNWGIYIADQDIGALHGAAALHIAGIGPHNSIGFSGANTDAENARIYSDGAGLLVIEALAIGINSTTRYASNGLDISSGDIALVLGADSGGIARTNNTVKWSRIGSAHYANAEEPVALLSVSSNNGYNILDFGGNSSTMNSATYIRFWTAGNGTTVTGAERLRIDHAGWVGIGTDGPGSRLDIGAGALTLAEMSAPSGAVNSARLFVQDNGAGKSQLMVVFGSGAAQQIAIEA